MKFIFQSNDPEQLIFWMKHTITTLESMGCNKNLKSMQKDLSNTEKSFEKCKKETVLDSLKKLFSWS